jgi:hypothetical protein
VFAASTRATKTEGGWLVNGRKIWTSGAHHADYMIALLRTSPSTKENRRHGLTQFLVEMKTPGITTRPIINLTGGHDFNEVVFDDAFLPDNHLIGDVDMAWKQATDELAYERSGPDRWIETFPALVELVRRAGEEPSERLAEAEAPRRRSGGFRLADRRSKPRWSGSRRTPGRPCSCAEDHQQFETDACRFREEALRRSAAPDRTNHDRTGQSFC